MRTAALIVVLALGTVPSAAQGDPLNDWINARIDSVVAARIAMRDGAKAPALPAGTGNGASLIDRAAMPDVVGISIELPNQPAAGAAAPSTTGAGISASPYLFLALLRGASPLDPSFYLNSALARRVGLNVSFDTEEATGASTAILHAKVLILDRGNPLAAAGSRVRGALQGATATFRQLAQDLQDLLFELGGRQLYTTKLAFLNALTSQAVLESFLSHVSADGHAAIDRLIESRVTSFVALRDTVAAVTADARSRPEFAIGATARATGNLTDQLRTTAIFDWMARPNLALTVNAGLLYERATLTVAERTSFEVAGQLLVHLTPDDRLEGRQPMSAAIAGSGAFGNGSVWRVQGKLNLPLTAGVTVPISITWASRTDLIDEDRVLGQLGFSFDAGQVFAGLR